MAVTLGAVAYILFDSRKPLGLVLNVRHQNSMWTLAMQMSMDPSMHQAVRPDALTIRAVGTAVASGHSEDACVVAVASDHSGSLAVLVQSVHSIDMSTRGSQVKQGRVGNRYGPASVGPLRLAGRAQIDGARLPGPPRPPVLKMPSVRTLGM